MRRLLTYASALALVLAAPAWAQNINGGLNVPGGGGGGSPGGADTQVQYNSGGTTFAGITGATTDGTALTLVAPVLGTPASGTLTNATGLPITGGTTGTLTVLRGGTGVTTSTGTGNVVLSTSPALTTPDLGTPTAATLTSATGLPIATGVSGLGTGVATALAAAKSGSGGLCLITSCAMVTPNLGTPSAVTLTNGVGLVASTGTTATGTPSSTTFLRGDNTWSSTGTVTSVVAGAGLTGGTITGSGTIALDTTISSWYPAYVSNNWYVTPMTQVASGTNVAINTLYCYAFPLFRSVTIKSLGARVTGAGSSNFQVAIYGDLAGFPNGAVLASTGNLSNGTPGTITLGITQTTAALPTGTYWACSDNGDGTAVFDSVAASGMPTSWLSGTAASGSILASGGAAMNGMTATLTFGSAWPTLTNSGWTQNSSTKMPVVIFQVN